MVHVPMGYGVIGNTADSGSVVLGSSPGSPATRVFSQTGNRSTGSKILKSVSSGRYASRGFLLTDPGNGSNSSETHVLDAKEARTAVTENAFSLDRFPFQAQKTNSNRNNGIGRRYPQ